MYIKLREIDVRSTKEISLPNTFNELNKNKVYWLEIKCSNNELIDKKLQQWGIDIKVTNHIKKPKTHLKTMLISDFVILNIPFLDISDLQKEHFITILACKNLLISIVDETNHLFDELLSIIKNHSFNFPTSVTLLSYFIVSEILKKGADINSSIRNQVNRLNNKMFLSSENLSIKDIIELKIKVSTVSNIVSEQYHILGFIPKIDWLSQNEEQIIRNEIKEVISGIGFLSNDIDRQEDKVNALYMQYQMVLHEKGNRKLNTLTVVQSIFVPLTFIAGIYGMNFTNMPELQWNAGYFIILGIMAAIGLGTLWWFKKDGWFD